MKMRIFSYIIVLMKYFLLAGSMLFALLGQFLLKKGVLVSTLAPSIGSIVQTLLSPFILLGLIMYGASAIIWLFVLQRFPLSIAYPALSITYIVVVTLSFILLKEPITPSKVAGILLIVTGVYFLFR